MLLPYVVITGPIIHVSTRKIGFHRVPFRLLVNKQSTLCFATA
jgi:hypothetical protein